MDEIVTRTADGGLWLISESGAMFNARYIIRICEDRSNHHEGKFAVFMDAVECDPEVLQDGFDSREAAREFTRRLARSMEAEKKRVASRCTTAQPLG